MRAAAWTGSPCLQTKSYTDRLTRTCGSQQPPRARTQLAALTCKRGPDEVDVLLDLLDVLHFLELFVLLQPRVKQ